MTSFVQELRTTDLYKAAGVSETLDWIAALVALDRTELDPATIELTLGILLKTRTTSFPYAESGSPSC